MKTDIFLRCLLLLSTTATLKCYNIDTKKKWSYASSHRDSLFGQKVLLHPTKTQNWVLVTAPTDNIQSRKFGGLHKCTIKPPAPALSCETIDLTRGMSQNLNTAQPTASLAKDASGILACVQQKKRHLKSITEELNGMCTLLSADFHNEMLLNITEIVEDLANKHQYYLFNHREEPKSRENVLDKEFPEDKSLQQNSDEMNRNRKNRRRRWRNVEEEQKKSNDDEIDDPGTEIAIVLDGSGSIDPEDFQRAKDFISNMMKSFWQKCIECEFAVVQYGYQIQTEFNLQESRNAPLALQKVQQIQQLKNVTKTASAIYHVLTEIFNETNGHKKGATKIIMVVTDGELFWDTRNLVDVINMPEMKDVERYAIGVGEAFNKTKALQELELIASDPDDKHLFRVTNYSALDGLLSMLQQKLFQMEGTKGEALKFELAQTGFSTHMQDKAF